MTSIYSLLQSSLGFLAQGSPDGQASGEQIVVAPSQENATQQAVPQFAGFDDAAAACTALASTFTYPGATVDSATHYAAGTDIPLDRSTPELQTCGAWHGDGSVQTTPADTCRVNIRVATSEHSGIKLEVWLPTQEDWEGRFLSTGNGGLGGCIQHADIAYGVESGFASVGSNNGHDGTSGEAFYQSPDVVTDYSWRAVWTETMVGRAVAETFYGREVAKSYYIGCSTGGRQGFQMAQQFPELFDGIVAGAPAFDHPALMAYSARFYPITGPEGSPTYIEPAKWALIHAELLKQCDGLDGVEDGLLEDPNLCDFKPLTLQCPSTAPDTSTCLTALQVATAIELLSPYYSLNGTLIYPRPQPGAEPTTAAVFFNGAPFAFSSDWFRYVVFPDPDFDMLHYNLSHAALAVAQNPSGVAAFSGDLSAFRARGGRLLHYHGMQDGLISGTNSERYYAHVAATMALAPSEIDEFYRYFRVSGLGHCGGGDGAWQVGQMAGGSADVERNVLRRVVKWVEEGEGMAPETITGVGEGVERRHCRWPRRGRCVDAKRWREADAWECVV